MISKQESTINGRKFYDSKGKLTSYALHCGYVHRAEKGPIRARLYWEHCCYTVRCIDDSSAIGNLFWKGYQRRANALRAYSQLKKKYNLVENTY